MFNAPRLLAAKPTLFLILSCLLALISLGCGGYGTSRRTSRGTIRFSVTWPVEAPTRLIPGAANSLVVQVKQGVTVVASQLVVKPTTTVTFPELPVGAPTVDVSAFASNDGTGTMMAWAAVPASIVADNTTNVNLTLASTIDHLEISPNPLRLGVLGTQAVTVTAKDANGNVVLVDPAALSFSSSNVSVISVDASGNLTAGSAAGNANLTVTDSESGKTVTASVSVVPTVSLTPASHSLTLRGTQTFAATVLGTANTAVTWSIQEGVSGGTITAGGLYTAPNAKGTYHVIATSSADTTVKATATVTVQSGGANVSIN